MGAGCSEMLQKDLAPREIKLLDAGHPCNRPGLTVWRKGGRTDGQERPRPLRSAGVPLPSQEARAAAELNEQLPFAEPVGLHHLTERLIGWGPTRKEKGGTCQTSGPVKMVPTIPFPWLHDGLGGDGGHRGSGGSSQSGPRCPPVTCVA